MRFRNTHPIRSAMVPCLLALAAGSGSSAEDLKGFDLQVKNLALQCRDEVAGRFEAMMKAGKLTQAQVFDTFYIPVPNSYPQRFHTQYDKACDEQIQALLDDYLKKNKRFVYFIIADTNGYVPTHNSRYTQALTGNKEVDIRINRAKLMFNDRTGLAAARNTAPYLIQTYARDTGETIHDLSVPIMVRDQHWGCVRVGYQ